MSSEAAQARCRRSARPGRCCCPAPCPQYTNRLRCLRASERAVVANPGAPTDPCAVRTQHSPMAAGHGVKRKSPLLMGSLHCSVALMRPLYTLALPDTISWNPRTPGSFNSQQSVTVSLAC